MRTPDDRSGRPSARDPLTPPERKALLCLHEAHQSAQRFHSDVWQFALELADLRHEGVMPTTLRGLVVQGLVVHARETTPPRADRRTVQLSPHLRFTERSCFVLTPAGAVLASRVQGPQSEQATTSEPEQAVPSFVTCADGRRELRVLGFVVKEFRVYAMNQEQVLAAFEEQHWPRWIKNPFLNISVNPKKRQHNTIDRLNRAQKHRLLRFHGDGTGLGISWELLPPADDTSTTH
jgi:hypothetical protein